MPATILPFPSRRPRRDLGIALGADQVRFPSWDTVEVVWLHLSGRQNVDPAEDISSRHLRIARPLDPAYKPLIHTDFRRNSSLRPPVDFTPFCELHTSSPQDAQIGRLNRAYEYDGATYLVNGHGEIGRSYYASVAYIYVMHPGNRLRHLRKAAGLTQADLAERTGFGQDRISNYENGRRPMRLQEMRALARELNCSVADILSDDDNPERLSEEERQLLEAFRSSSKTARQFLLTSANAVADDHDTDRRSVA